MGAVRVRKETKTLYLDFYADGKRYRVQTNLVSSKSNKRSLEMMMSDIDSEIDEGTFDPFGYFPSLYPRPHNHQTRAKPRPRSMAIVDGQLIKFVSAEDESIFGRFAEEWFLENVIRWKPSYMKKVREILDNYLIPTFGHQSLKNITKGAILKFRADLPQMTVSGRGIGPSYINSMVCVMNMILTEGEERFGGFTSPMKNIKPLRDPQKPIHPFSLTEIQLFINGVRDDFRNYYTVSFFTAMRSSELNGLPWANVDFAKRVISIRQALVEGQIVQPKNAYSNRDILMSPSVFEALKNQFKKTGHQNGFVFCDFSGNPYCCKYVRRSVWYPTLNKLGLKIRKPNQTRHTTASLWLASGENPEWIKGQMGHATTEMLFKRYSHFVPNLTRKDGSAFEKMITKTDEKRSKEPE